MTEKFCLYIDNFSFSDCYSTNSISCEAFMPNKKGSKTISRNTQDFLFITHKKLNAESRMIGIDDHLTSWPVTLEIEVDFARFEHFPVVFAKQDNDSVVLKYGDLRDYDEAVHLGCYVFSGISFSLVSRIMFETEDQLFDSDKSIFPDFWWREDIISVINQKEYTDTLSLSFTDEKITAQLPGNNYSAERESLVSNKYQAAILQMVNGTREWVVGKHKTNFDPFLMQFFGIDPEKAKTLFDQKDVSIPDDLFQCVMEPLSLIPRLSEETDINDAQRIYNAIVDCLIENREKCAPTVVSSILTAITDKLSALNASAAYEETIKEIEVCSQNAIGYSVENTLRNIADRHGEDSVLKALFYTMKNPSEFDKFALSLSIYKVDSLTSRRAMVLWGFLNGTKGIPARDYNRDNLQLWKSIEWSYVPFSECDAVSKEKAPCEVSAADLGIELQCEEIITFEEVHAFLMEKIQTIKGAKAILRDIYMIAKNLDRKMSKEDPYCGYSITEENFFSLLPKPASHLMTKAETDSFEKAYTKTLKDLFSSIKRRPEFDYKAIHNEWVVNEANFRKIWGIQESDLKSLFVRARG